MNWFEIILIALGLAMDAFAVSIASGVTLQKFKFRIAFRVAFFFGFFQAIMPLIGWFAGHQFSRFISAIDHWLAFGLLAFIGGKMIYESTILEKTETTCDPRKINILFILAVATSIDALAIGLSFSFLNITIITPVLIIGLVTFFLSFLGVFLGDRFGRLFEGKIELIGGIVLIAIGTKILFEHLFGF